MHGFSLARAAKGAVNHALVGSFAQAPMIAIAGPTHAVPGEARSGRRRTEEETEAGSAAAAHSAERGADCPRHPALRKTAELAENE